VSLRYRLRTGSAYTQSEVDTKKVSMMKKIVKLEKKIWHWETP